MKAPNQVEENHPSPSSSASSKGAAGPVSPPSTVMVAVLEFAHPKSVQAVNQYLGSFEEGPHSKYEDAGVTRFERAGNWSALVSSFPYEGHGIHDRRIEFGLQYDSSSRRKSRVQGFPGNKRSLGKSMVMQQKGNGCIEEKTAQVSIYRRLEVSSHIEGVHVNLS